jgi:hypothetical protein
MIRIAVAIQQPTDAEIGLLLLLLKDLWTGDLPLGGEISVGRGRLQGIIARLNFKQANRKDPENWVIEKADESLKTSGVVENLETFVDAFVEEIKA